ncbi:hypothetical protein Q1W70_15315 [Pseudomonas kielensis]|jgi:hypothetical protein|uniref:hypothetical protein n=1 Tax=Pseudomonas kielensis TaxID=2762577 RepID=UPI0026604C45|nr:hypothetical protein [Pseudomonas kielensis]WKL50876.1 hypothetical protein Q1W70_15315 [Pseudomonas kielensis]
MTWFATLGWQYQRIAQVFVILLTLAAIRLCAQSGEPEIALVIGEPYEAMRQRSSAAIAPAIPREVSFNIPKSDARLRFTDPQYGFVTPSARFFTVIYRDELIHSIRMSPQIEPLLLEDTLRVVLDLQEQWHKAGWVPIRVEQDPPFADTPQWRARLRDVNKGGTSYWQAGNQYQVMLVVNRFKDIKRPTEERYLIKLALARPWVKP